MYTGAALSFGLMRACRGGLVLYCSVLSDAGGENDRSSAIFERSLLTICTWEQLWALASYGPVGVDLFCAVVCSPMREARMTGAPPYLKDHYSSLKVTCQCRQGLGACCKVTTARGAHLSWFPTPICPRYWTHTAIFWSFLNAFCTHLGNLRIRDSLSEGCVEHFHKFWLMYAESDLNVTRAPSIGRS